MKIPSVRAGSKVRLQQKTLELCLACVLATSTATFAVSRIDVLGGALDIGATLSAGVVHVGAGAVLSGDGTIYGNLTVEGSIAPSALVPSPASLFVYGDVSFLSGSSYHCHATTHTQHDGLTVNGTLSGICLVVPTKESGAIPVKQIIGGLKYGSFIGFSLSPADEPNWKLERSGGVLTLTDLVGDSDLNTLPDWFELEYFLVRTGTDPDGHGDDDGMTNWEELIAGTDPTDGSSAFALKLIYLGDSDFRLEWPSVAGRRYSIFFGEQVSPRTTPLFEDLTAQPPTNWIGMSNWSDVLDTTFIHGTVRRETE